MMRADEGGRGRIDRRITRQAGGGICRTAARAYRPRRRVLGLRVSAARPSAVSSASLPCGGWSRR